MHKQRTFEFDPAQRKSAQVNEVYFHNKLIITEATIASRQQLVVENELLNVRKIITNKEQIIVVVGAWGKGSFLSFGYYLVALSDADHNTVANFVQNYIPGNYTIISNAAVDPGFRFPTYYHDQEDVKWEYCEHDNPHMDNCTICAPYWGEYPVCPYCGEKLIQDDDIYKGRCGFVTARTDNLCEYCGSERSFVTHQGKRLGKACYLKEKHLEA